MKFLNAGELSILWAVSIDAPKVSGDPADLLSLERRELVRVCSLDGRREVLITELGRMVLRIQHAKLGILP